MIKIRRFDEKVSKAEKEEILKDPDIRVGVEFEIESEESVFGEEFSDEDYQEEYERRLDDMLSSGTEELMLVEDFVDDRIRQSRFKGDDWAVLSNFIGVFRGRYDNAFEEMGYDDSQTNMFLEILQNEYNIITYDYSKQMNLFPESKRLKEEISFDLSKDIYFLQDLDDYIVSYFGNETRYHRFKPKKFAIELKNGGIASFEIDNGEVTLLEEYTDWNNKENVPVIDDEDLEEEMDLNSLEEDYNDLLIDLAREAVTIDMEDFRADKDEGDSQIVSDLEEIIGDDIDVVDEYHSGSNDWRIESDASLSSRGAFELITPNGGMPLDELFPIMKGVFDYISNSGDLYTSQSTGLHVNMSIRGVDLEKEMDPFKLALFMEEGKVFKYFESRKNNRYTLSVLRELKQPGAAEKLSGKKKKEFQEIMEDMNRSIIPKSKYYGINLSKVESGLNYVEFRYLGGKDYHTKYGIIRRQILDYGFFLKVATQKDYKWKEYMRKINRLLNSMEDKIVAQEIKNEIIEVSNQILMKNEYLFTKASEEFNNILERINEERYKIGEFRYHLENCMKDFILRSFTLFRENMIDDDYLWTHLEQFVSTAGDSIKEYWPTGTLLWDDLIKGQIQKMKDRGKIDYPVEPIIKRLRI